MKNQQWTFIDKSLWPERGPWDTEPDKAQWLDDETGLPCLAVRNRSHWCGYVEVNEGHPFFKVPYDNAANFEVHGGLTFSGFCQPGEEAKESGICHIVEAGENDRVWWLGFDCVHSGDKAPATCIEIHRINLEYPHSREYETYRTLNYVQGQCRKLAAQLLAEGLDRIEGGKE